MRLRERTLVVALAPQTSVSCTDSAPDFSLSLFLSLSLCFSNGSFNEVDAEMGRKEATSAHAATQRTAAPQDDAARPTSPKVAKKRKCKSKGGVHAPLSEERRWVPSSFLKSRLGGKK